MKQKFLSSWRKAHVFWKLANNYEMVNTCVKIKYKNKMSEKYEKI